MPKLDLFHSDIFNKGTARYSNNLSVGTQGNNKTQNDAPLLNKSLQKNLKETFRKEKNFFG